MRSRRTVINAKGQVTIPSELRERWGIKKGTRIHWKGEQGRLVLTPITEFEASLHARRRARRRDKI